MFGGILKAAGKAIIGGIGAGIGSGVSSRVSNAINPASSALSAQQAIDMQNTINKTNIDIADKNNAAMIDLANTSYQRKSSDLEKAGLNPMMAYIQGSGGGAVGAAVPALQQAKAESGAVAAAQNAQIRQQSALINAQTEAALSTAANQDAQAESNSADAALKRGEYIYTYGNPFSEQNGMGGMINNRAMAQIEQLNSQDRLNSSQARYYNELKNEIIPRINKMIAERDLTEAQEALSQANTRATLLGLPKIQAESDAYSTAIGKFLPFIPGFSSLANSAKDISSITKKPTVINRFIPKR